MEEGNSNAKQSKSGGTVAIGGQSLADEQLKRLLALIENNSKADALSRDTTNNILIRIDVIERKLRSRRANSNTRSPLENHGNYSSQLPSSMSRIQHSIVSDENRSSSPHI